MTLQTSQNKPAGQGQILGKLLAAEWAAGIAGLKLFTLCVAISAFMMGSVWTVGGGLSNMLARGGTTFLGGDVAITTTNVPLSRNTALKLGKLGQMSEVWELRTSANVNGARAAAEIKGVDNAYPLYGKVILESGREIDEILNGQYLYPPAIVERSLLTKTDATIGDTLQLGDHRFTIADILSLEPDRLSAGRFMIGPRILVSLDVIGNSGLIKPGSIVDYRYRLKQNIFEPAELIGALEELRPETGWELETPQDAGDRVLRTVDRTTSFLGVTGVVALAIGLSGAWAGAKAWIRRRSRTIALYRLSGASPAMVMALHASILAFAGVAGLVLGLGASLILAVPLIDLITAQLNITWGLSDLIYQVATVTIVLLTGLGGSVFLAISGAARVSPGAAMRSGEAPLTTDPWQAAMATMLIGIAVAVAALTLPIVEIAVSAILGFLATLALLAVTAALLSRSISRLTPRSFFGIVVSQALSRPADTITRTTAVGIGIIGITTVIAAQSSLSQTLNGELPDRVPDLVLLDVQPSQVNGLRDRIQKDSQLDGLQADPFMRMTILEVNGVSAKDALVRDDKSWVIEGDRSFSWTATPTVAELLQGEWWDADYFGPPLISPEEDVMEAFDLKVGDNMTYSVLGRTFTSEVVNIRKEYHRTFRPEYLMVASPQPFRDAPHTWIMSLQGADYQTIDSFVREVAETHPGVTSIDIRPFVAQVRSVIDGATLASVLIALLLIVAGALSVSALIASDVDSKRREALAFSLVGASRREIALLRLSEAAATGVIAAILGGIAGITGGYFIVTEGMRIDWSPNIAVFLFPFVLGVAASIIAGIVGGLGAVPRGRGQMVRQLTT